LPAGDKILLLEDAYWQVKVTAALTVKILKNLLFFISGRKNASPPLLSSHFFKHLNKLPEIYPARAALRGGE
jgi:hypothetical protein